MLDILWKIRELFAFWQESDVFVPLKEFCLGSNDRRAENENEAKQLVLTLALCQRPVLLSSLIHLIRSLVQTLI